MVNDGEQVKSGEVGLSEETIVILRNNSLANTTQKPNGTIADYSNYKNNYQLILT